MRALIMAGGTGGHIYPALAVARWLVAQGHEVVWLGSRVGMEQELVPKAGFELETIEVSGLRGKGLLGWLGAPVRLLRALAQAASVLRRRRPDVLLGMGGFASGPGGLAGVLQRIPLVLHEQNALPGLTNRVLARVATQVLEAFPEAFGAKFKARCVGNPVRSGLLEMDDVEQRFAQRQGKPRLLVLGGSQGALALNRLLPQALALLPAAQRPEVVHQCGKRHWETTRDAYAEAGVGAEVLAYVDDIERLYGWADLAICRSGALTVTELSAAGLGSVLVPFPHAVDDHQTLNARHLERLGAARLMPESALSPERLAKVLGELLGERSQLVRMGEAARAFVNPNAAQQIGEQLLALAGGEGEKA